MLMKKSLIALAVAGAMVAPMVAQADATLYGSMRIELNDWDSGSSLDLNDNSSRVGIKGDVDLGLEGTKGIFQWEFNINTTDDNQYGDLGERLGLIGATGDWGTALVGRQYHPHFLWVNLNTYLFSDATMGEAAFLGNTGHKRTENTLAYVSPSMNGFTVAGGLVIEGTADSEDVDGHNFAVKYAGNGLTAALSFGDLKSNGAVGLDREVVGASVKYAVNEAATVMARYEDADQTGNDQKVWFLGGSYKIENTTLKLGYGDLEVDNGVTTADGDYWAAEVHQKMGKGAVYAAYADFNDFSGYASGAGIAATGDNELFTVGYRLDF
jgi:predicted porin